MSVFPGLAIVVAVLGLNLTGDVVADALDPQAVLDAVVGARPEVVVHQLTDIPQKLDFRHYAEQMAGNDRVREEGTRHLLSSALAAGARRMVAQSISFAYQPDGDWVKTEDAPLWLDAPEEFRRTVKVLDGLERSVTQTEGIDGVVLRYGFFYGPGTSYAADGHLAEEIRRRRLPLVGRGTGMSSFIHVDDAAEATALALERGSGILNVVDDDPAPASEWMPVYAEALGAKPPRRVPRFLARLLAGPMITQLATEGRGASNERAKRELGWAPKRRSWRDGFRELAR